MARKLTSRTNIDDYRIVLASGSPRRQAILDMLGIAYLARAVNVDERRLPDEPPETAVQRLAWSKAKAALPCRGVVVAADTVVVLDGEILGKPRDAAEAWNALRRLRGRRHEVITGLAIVNPSAHLAHVSSHLTAVWMRDYGDSEIADYIAAGDPFDKAGSYAIQSESFRPVARIEGCYLNVVGLPACGLMEGLRSVGALALGNDPARVCEMCARCAAAGKSVQFTE